jgi:hypothetical protein
MSQYDCCVILMMKTITIMIIVIIIIQASAMPQRQSSNEESMYILWYVASRGLVYLNIVSEERTVSIFRIEN